MKYRGDLGPYPVFQPKQSRPKQISVFPKFGKKYHVPDPEIHDCKKKLQRGSSFEYLPRSKYDPNRQFNYIKSEPREMDQNTISKISYHPPMPQNRGMVSYTKIVQLDRETDDVYFQ